MLIFIWSDWREDKIIWGLMQGSGNKIEALEYQNFGMTAWEQHSITVEVSIVSFEPVQYFLH